MQSDKSDERGWARWLSRGIALAAAVATLLAFGASYLPDGDDHVLLPDNNAGSQNDDSDVSIGDIESTEGDVTVNDQDLTLQNDGGGQALNGEVEEPVVAGENSGEMMGGDANGMIVDGDVTVDGPIVNGDGNTFNNYEAPPATSTPPTTRPPTTPQIQSSTTTSANPLEEQADPDHQDQAALNPPTTEPAKVQVLVTGEFTGPGQERDWTVDGSNGQQLVVQVNYVGAPGQCFQDLYLEVVSPVSQVLLREWFGESSCETKQVTLNASGTYTIRVSSGQGLLISGGGPEPQPEGRFEMVASL